MSYSPQADAIIADLGDCKTVQEVNTLAKKERSAVHLMSLDPKLAVRAIHIKNMAAYMREKLMGRLRDKPR